MFQNGNKSKKEPKEFGGDDKDYMLSRFIMKTTV